MQTLTIDWANTSAWLTSAAIATIVAAIVTFFSTAYWERRKLSRAELIKSIGEYLAADSERWRAFGDRDGLRKAQGLAKDPAAFEKFKSLPEVVAVQTRIEQARDRMWSAYSHTQIVAPKRVVIAMFRCIKVSDDRQRSFNGLAKSPPNPEHARVIRELVLAARKSFFTRTIKLELFKSEN